MALVDRYFRDPSTQLLSRVTMDEAAPIDALLVDGVEYVPDGAAEYAAQAAAAAQQAVDARIAAAAAEQAAAVVRLATLNLVVDAVNTINPTADLTVAQLVDALAGSAANQQALLELLAE